MCLFGWCATRDGDGGCGRGDDGGIIFMQLLATWHAHQLNLEQIAELAVVVFIL